MVQESSKSSLQVWQIAKVNLRHNFLPLLLLSILIMVLTPVLFGTTNLDNTASAVPLEMLISIIGIILLVPIFQPEQNSEIQDITSSKYVDSVDVYLIRISYSIMAIVFLILIFSFFMLVCGCQITPSLVIGTVADAMFLGSIGLIVSAVTNNLPVSFMVPLLYYMLNLSLQDKFGNFNLFAMMAGEYAPNLWILSTSIILIVTAIATKNFLLKHR